MNDLGIEAGALRSETELPRIEGEALAQEDEACRGLKQKLEVDGPGQHDGARRVQGNRTAP